MPGTLLDLYAPLPGQSSAPGLVAVNPAAPFGGGGGMPAAVAVPAITSLASGALGYLGNRSAANSQAQASAQALAYQKQMAALQLQQYNADRRSRLSAWDEWWKSTHNADRYNPYAAQLAKLQDLQMPGGSAVTRPAASPYSGATLGALMGGPTA